MPGTDGCMCYAPATAGYAMFGTDVAYAATSFELAEKCREVPGSAICYARAMRCPVLKYRLVLPAYARAVY
eukprot:3937494-Rhodomonas_salina.1